MSFFKISCILLLTNVNGLQKTPRRHLKNKLLGQRVFKNREYKRLIASATHLSLDDLENLAETPGVLFNREHNSLTMSLDDLEKLSISPEKLEKSNWNDIMKK